MKQIETIAAGANFSAVNVGKLSEIIEYVLPMGPDVKIQGKVFAGPALGTTGSELRFPARTAVSSTRTRRTRNSTSSSAARASIRWMARCSPSEKAVWSAWLPPASVL